jgi:hypothetical protein
MTELRDFGQKAHRNKVVKANLPKGGFTLDWKPQGHRFV